MPETKKIPHFVDKNVISKNNYTLADISSKVDIEIKLHKKDKVSSSSMHNVVLAEEVSKLLKFHLEETILNKWSSKTTLDDYHHGADDADTSKLTLQVTIVRCTEGSRMDRLCCCSELLNGKGLALLYIDWKLIESTGLGENNDNGGKKIIMGIEHEIYSDTGGGGCADLFSTNVGDNAVLHAAGVIMPRHITHKVEHALVLSTTTKNNTKGGESETSEGEEQ